LQKPCPWDSNFLKSILAKNPIYLFTEIDPIEEVIACKPTEMFCAYNNNRGFTTQEAAQGGPNKPRLSSPPTAV